MPDTYVGLQTSGSSMSVESGADWCWTPVGEAIAAMSSREPLSAPLISTIVIESSSKTQGSNHSFIQL